MQIAGLDTFLRQNTIVYLIMNCYLLILDKVLSN